MLKVLSLILCFSMIVNAGTLKGVVNYAGSNKTPKDLKMDSDPVCGNAHSVPPKKEDFILDENNNFKNVIVWLNISYDGKTPEDSVTIDQKGCIYIPRVLGVMQNQKVSIKNSDKTLHNVHSMPKINDSFNSAQPAGVPEIVRSFSETEAEPFYIKCDVHPWMKSWILVTDHPYFSVTDENGNYSIKNIPAGTYEAIFWQEKLSNLSKKKYEIVQNTASVIITEEKETIQNYTFQKPIKKKK